MSAMITLTAEDGFELAAYRATPNEPPRGGVVIVQEIFGLTDHIKSVCDRYAKAGYIAVAPAYFDRAEPGVALDYSEIEKGLGYVGKLNDDTTMMDTKAGAAALQGADNLAVIGYCWGGSVAYLAASRLADTFSCAVAYYGGRIKNYLDSDPPEIPLMYHFGSEDHAIPLDTVDEVRAKHPEGLVHVYDGVGHGFNCDERDDYDEQAAELAFDRTITFLDQNL